MERLFVRVVLYLVQRVIANCDQYASDPDSACMLQDGISTYDLGPSEKKLSLLLDHSRSWPITKKVDGRSDQNRQAEAYSAPIKSHHQQAHTGAQYNLAENL